MTQFGLDLGPSPSPHDLDSTRNSEPTRASLFSGERGLFVKVTQTWVSGLGTPYQRLGLKTWTQRLASLPAGHQTAADGSPQKTKSDFVFKILFLRPRSYMWSVTRRRVHPHGSATKLFRQLVSVWNRVAKSFPCRSH